MSEEIWAKLSFKPSTAAQNAGSGIGTAEQSSTKAVLENISKCSMKV
jgi:hypothetical protein